MNVIQQRLDIYNSSFENKYWTKVQVFAEVIMWKQYAK